jgi:hypothetical protein
VRDGVAVAAFVLCVAASAAHAQRVRGTVTDHITSDAVSGAVVVLTDSAGRQLSRTIADANGRFSLPGAPLVRRMRVVRIGYRPREIAVAANDSVVDVRMEQVPTRLAATTAVEDRVCPGGDSLGVAYEIWEQARAGLLASVVARETNAPRVRLRSFRRTIDPLSRRPIADTVDYHEIVDSRSFIAARPAWVFAEFGYIRELGGGVRDYYAPDEVVMLDPTFADTHCLRGIEGRGPRRDQIGLAFDPIAAPDRDTLVDVSGALWLDRSTLALRAIEFRYTNLEHDARDAGGEIQYVTMPNGVPMIERWVIHSPMLAFDVPSVPTGLARRDIPRAERRGARVVGFREIGGQVLFATWTDGRRWVSDLPRIEGSIVDSRGAPVGGAVVWLRDSRDTVRADARGHFEFPPMPPGEYVVLASDSVLAADGIIRAIPTRTVLFTDQSATVKLEFHPRSEILRAVCPSQSYRVGTGVLLARIVDSRGVPAANARVEVETVQLGAAGDTLGRRASRLGVASDEGRFVVCGAEIDRSLVLRAYKGDEAAGIAISRWGDEVVSLSLSLKPVRP